VTFAVAKISHFVHPAAAFCGKVVVVPIGMPRAVIENAGDARCTTPDDIRAAFTPRGQGDFKNRFGHLAVFGGLRGKAGAAILAGRAAMRSGAGLVTLATDHDTASCLEGRFPDLMIEGPFDITSGQIECNVADLQNVLSGKSAVVVGPGLSTRAGSDVLISRIMDAPLPAVLDADALNVLSARPLKHRYFGPDVVLTPHPGEAARLLDMTTAEVQSDRVAAVRQLATLTGAVVVLKGAGTLIAGPDKILAVCPAGSPALATAGTGDVLAGVIGALLARGVAPFNAACAAVHLHAIAGELGAERFTEHGLGASDLVDLLPVVLSRIIPPGAK
jgi:NAD(P)H-hydrate epimerase